VSHARARGGLGGVGGVGSGAGTTELEQITDFIAHRSY